MYSDDSQATSTRWNRPIMNGTTRTAEGPISLLRGTPDIVLPEYSQNTSMMTNVLQPCLPPHTGVTCTTEAMQ